MISCYALNLALLLNRSTIRPTAGQICGCSEALFEMHQILLAQFFHSCCDHSQQGMEAYRGSLAGVALKFQAFLL